MVTNYVLIDYENVQPKNMELLRKDPFKVLVFVGASQKSIVFDLADSLQKFGDKAKYIRISGNGKNALDFHIAFYIGQLSLQDPKGIFHIISKDTGFDPLVKHLKSKNIRVNRVKNLAEISILKISSFSSNDDKIDTIIKNLTRKNKAIPRKQKTLKNYVKNLFAEDLSDEELAALISTLKDKKLIFINNENVSYDLPKKA